MLITRSSFLLLVSVVFLPSWLSAFEEGGSISYAGRLYAAGPEPVKVVVADFDNDQDLDFVTGNFTGASLTTYANVGDETFARIDSSVGMSGFVRCIDYGDIDGDSDLDVVAVVSTSAAVKIARNNGDFSFSVSTISLSGQPQGVALGDLDADSDLDLVVANRSAKTATVFFNNGSGSFVFSQEYDVGNSPYSVELADWNGDELIDIAVANGSGNDVSILHNAGSGIFSTEVRHDVGVDARDIEVTDLNGDQHPDLITANFFGDSISVLMNDGVGSFETAVEYPCGDGARSVKAVDIDQDSDIDLLVANSTEDSLVVFLNDGTGLLTLAANYYASDDPESVDVGDLNFDGFPDVVIARRSGGAMVLFNDGTGELISNRRYDAGGPPEKAVAGDIDGDQDLDLVIINSVDNKMHIMVNDGQGRFLLSKMYSIPEDALEIVLGDWDVDADIDVAIACSGAGDQIAIYLNNGAGQFVPGNAIQTPNPNTLEKGDINRDGILDLVTNDGDELLIFTNDGQANFQLSASYDLTFTSSFYDLAIEDFDADEDMDIAALGQISTGGVLYVFYNEKGKFGEYHALSAGNEPHFLICGDFNADNYADLAALTVIDEFVAELGVYFNIGNGFFFNSEDYRAFNTPAIALGDVNGDTSLDIVRAGNGAVLLYFNDGTGDFSIFSPEIYQCGPGSSFVLADDFNGDCLTDVVTFNLDSNDISVLLARSEAALFLPYIVESFSVFRGNLISGELDDLALDDEKKVVIRPGIVLTSEEAPIWVVFESSVPLEANDLAFAHESQTNTPGIVTTIEAWNWQKGDYQIIGSVPSSFGMDETVVTELGFGVPEFVDTVDGNVRMRLGWRAEGPILVFPGSYRSTRRSGWPRSNNNDNVDEFGYEENFGIVIAQIEWQSQRTL